MNAVVYECGYVQLRSGSCIQAPDPISLNPIQPQPRPTSQQKHTQAKTIINSKKDKLLAAVRPDSKAKAQEVLTQLTAKLDEVAQVREGRERSDVGRTGCRAGWLVGDTIIDRICMRVRLVAPLVCAAIPTPFNHTHNKTKQTFDEDAGRGSEQERAKLDLAYAQQLRVSF